MAKPSPAMTTLGHGLAKVFGIKLDYRNEQGKSESILRGESVFSVSSADTYVEDEPSALDWLAEVTPSGSDFVQYLKNLFPFIQWLPRYNLTWLVGDMIAGVTIGAVVVPQGMAYAKLAELDVQFGLYTAFMGLIIYWLFGTSKDITIGPVAVASQLTGGVVLAALTTLPNVPSYQVVGALALISGAVIAFLGFARLGFIVDFISATAVSAFITGSALNIGIGQIYSLLGISKTLVNNRDPMYRVIIDTLKNLPNAKIDAALGMTALVLLYAWRFACNYGARRMPSKARLFFFVSTLRTVIVILLYTLISWAAQSNNAAELKDGSKGYKKSKWKILGPVPRGFQYAGVPNVTTHIISEFGSQLPAVIIVLLIEHIAIAKSFGRINNYTINPSQELVAIGVTNLLGPFLGAYPATGSFSRTAIKSKAGVRTPLAGLISAVVVLLAIYALPAVFFWIPSAALSAVIIHAVFDLILPPNTVYQFWKIAPLEVFVFLAGVLVTVFSTIEDGIYTTICISIAILLFRLAKARGRFLGKVKIHSVVGDHVMEQQKTAKGNYSVQQRSVPAEEDGSQTRSVYLPINHLDGSNPRVGTVKPQPGVFIYRFSEGFNYPNSNHYMDHLLQTVFDETRRTNANTYGKPGDRPWNDPGPKKGQEHIDEAKPLLKAIILDFSSVNNVDVTVAQNLIDVRNQLDRYAAPDTVEWHFACITNRWTKRALVAAGFGYPTPESETGELHRWKPIYSVAEMGGETSAAAAAENAYNKEALHDIEASRQSISKPGRDPRIAVVQGLNRPFFHIDVAGAVESVNQSIERRENYTMEANSSDTPSES